MADKRYIAFGLAETGQHKILVCAPGTVVTQEDKYPLPCVPLYGTKDDLLAKLTELVDRFFGLVVEDDKSASL